MMVKSVLDFFYFEIQQAPSDIGAKYLVFVSFEIRISGNRVMRGLGYCVGSYLKGLDLF